MFTPLNRFSILTAFVLLFALDACKPKAVNDANVPASIVVTDSAAINKLIAKGKQFENDNIDSLPAIISRLNNIGVASGDKQSLIYANIFQSFYYWMKVEYPPAMQYALKALAGAEKWKTDRLKPEIYGMIGNLHKENSNYPSALKSASTGLEFAQINKDTSEIIKLLGLKAMFTHSHYLNQHKVQDDHSSLQMELEALKIAESSPKFERIRIRFYNNIAQTYKDRKDYTQALAYVNKAVVLANKYNQPRSLTYSYNWLGETYYYLGDHAKGIGYLWDAIRISRRLNEPYREMEIYSSLYSCYLSSGNYKEALSSLANYSQMKDSLQVIKNEKQVSDMQMKYETNKKDEQITGLNQSNQSKNNFIVWILLCLLVFVTLFVIIITQYIIIRRNSKLTKENNVMLNEALLKIAFIQSHHLRKPMASIIGLMNIIKSEDYHADKEVLLKLDQVAYDLDEMICDLIGHTEVKYNDDHK